MKFAKRNPIAIPRENERIFSRKLVCSFACENSLLDTQAPFAPEILSVSLSLCKANPGVISQSHSDPLKQMSCTRGHAISRLAIGGQRWQNLARNQVSESMSNGARGSLCPLSSSVHPVTTVRRERGNYGISGWNERDGDQEGNHKRSSCDRPETGMDI